MADIEHNTLGNTANNHGIAFATVANYAALAAVAPTAAQVAQQAVWRQTDTGLLWVPRSTAAGDFAILAPVDLSSMVASPPLYDDFDTVIAPATGTGVILNAALFGRLGWRAGFSGAAATLNAVTTGVDQNHVGVIRVSKGTTATGFSLATGGIQSLVLGASNRVQQHWLVQGEALSDGTNTYAFRCGKLDSVGTPTQGVYFEHVASTGNWRLVAMLGGVPTVASGGASVAMTPGVFQHLYWLWNGSGLEGFVDGVPIGTIVAGFPIVGLQHQFGIIGSLGAADRGFLIDLFDERKFWIVPRAA